MYDKKVNDVFYNVTSTPHVSDYDLYARERRLEATDSCLFLSVFVGFCRLLTVFVGK